MDVVFDIDWTLFYPVEKHIDHHTVVLPEGAFHMADGAADVILALHQAGYRISLFSGGLASRNKALAKFLIQEIRQRGDKKFKFYKVLNREDLTLREGASPTAKFSEKWMKDLTKINSDLSRVVMVDDSDKFMVPGQEKNLYWIQKTYNFEKYFSVDGGGSYQAPNFSEWQNERRKIISFGENLLQRSVVLRTHCAKAFLAE